MEQLLTQSGLEVVSYNRAQTAFETFQADPGIDLVITDLRMPEMTGQSLIMRIRKYETESGRPRTPIMVLTGEAAQNERVACLGQYGADEYLLKPIKLLDLMSSVETLLTASGTQKNRKKRKRRMLVVEDELMSQRLIMSFIRSTGDEAFGCGTVAEAKLEVERNCGRYQGIMLDSQLPDGTGRDFLQYCHTVVKGRGVRLPPVVSMSGNSVEDQKSMYEGLEVYAFMVKPVSKSQLTGLMRSIR